MEILGKKILICIKKILICRPLKALLVKKGGNFTVSRLAVNATFLPMKSFLEVAKRAGLLYYPLDSFVSITSFRFAKMVSAWRV